jgi:hypothetical protein
MSDSARVNPVRFMTVSKDSWPAGGSSLRYELKVKPPCAAGAFEGALEL